MTGTNEFLAIAGSGGANVITQAEYAALTAVLDDGFSAGIARSNQVNKVLRQTTAMASMLGEFIKAYGWTAADDGNIAGLLANFEAAIASLVSGMSAETSGVVKMYAGSTAPAGYLECNGAAISRTTYAALFSAVGTAFGAGDGSTTFNIPDFRGYSPRGWDHGRGVDAGRSLGSSQADQNLSHTHTASVTDLGHAHAVNHSQGNVNANGTYIAGIDVNVSSTGTATTSATTGISVTNSSSGGTEVRVKNVAIMFIIKT